MLQQTQRKTRETMSASMIAFNKKAYMFSKCNILESSKYHIHRKLKWLKNKVLD